MNRSERKWERIDILWDGFLWLLLLAALNSMMEKVAEAILPMVMDEFLFSWWVVRFCILYFVSKPLITRWRGIK